MPDYSKLIEMKKWQLENERPSFMDVATPAIQQVIGTSSAVNQNKQAMAMQQMIEAKKQKAEFVQKLLTDKGYMVYKVDEKGNPINPTIDDMVNTYVGVMNNTGLPKGMSLKPAKESQYGERSAYKFNKTTGEWEKSGATFWGKEDKFLEYGANPKDTLDDVYKNRVARNEADIATGGRWRPKTTEEDEDLFLAEPTAQPTPKPVDKILVISPAGVRGYVPAAQLESALQQGYKRTN